MQAASLQCFDVTLCHVLTVSRFQLVYGWLRYMQQQYALQAASLQCFDVTLCHVLTVPRFQLVYGWMRYMQQQYACRLPRCSVLTSPHV